MFIASLCTIAKTQKEPKCPWTDEWIKEMWYRNIYSGILLSHKNELMPFVATCMDLKVIILSQYIRQRKKYHVILLTSAMQQE